MKIIKNIYDVGKEIKTIQKAIRRRKQRSCQYRELSSRINELKNSKTDVENKIEALKQIILHNEEVKDEVKLKIKQLKKKNKQFPEEIPFDFTDYVERQKKRKRDRSRFISRTSRRKQDYIQSNTRKHSHRKFGKIEKRVFYERLF